MNVRQRALSMGWYPDSDRGVRDFIAVEGTSSRGQARACLAPHAGWYYSGALALAALESLDPSLECLLVMAGHLHPNSPIHIALEDAFQTPSGRILQDRSLCNALLEELERQKLEGKLSRSPVADRQDDNGVEVLLPFISVLFPSAKILSLRLPPSVDALVFAAALSRVSERAGMSDSLGLVASSDLTHYGPHYGFEPAGRVSSARSWVHEVNDKALLDAIYSQDAEAVIERALDDSSACSSGAIAVLVQSMKARTIRLIGRSDSLERGPSPSFVSYAALAWE